MLLSINDATDGDFLVLLLVFGFIFLLFIAIVGLGIVAIFKGIDRISKKG